MLRRLAFIAIAVAMAAAASDAAAQQRNPRAAAAQMRTLLDGSPQGTVRIEPPKPLDARPGEISVPLKSGGTVEEKFRVLRSTEKLVGELAEKADQLKAEARIAADYCAVAFWRIKVEIEVNGYGRTPMAVIERARATCETARNAAERREAVASAPSGEARRPAAAATEEAAPRPVPIAVVLSTAQAEPPPVPAPMAVADLPAAPAAQPEAPPAPLDDALQGH